MKRIKRLSQVFCFFSRVSIVLILLFLTGCQTASLRSAGTDVNANPALWLAQQGDSSVYLFGSVHALPKGVRWYGPKIAQAFEQADELVIESIAEPASQQQAVEYVMANAMLPDGSTLDQLLSRSDYEKVQLIAQQLGLEEEVVNRLQPWFFRLMLANEMFDQSDIHSNYGVDNLFEKRARQVGMKVSGLESPQNALKSLASYPLYIQAKQLSAALNPQEQQQMDAASVDELVVTWALGDVQNNAKLIASTMTPYVYRRVVSQRNTQWLPRIEHFLTQPQQTLIVVGNAHLVGKSNLIDMLKKRGYNIERMQ